ncbi:TGL2 [[Candida] subhashii]|uniref:TGL2 n=1 Tax=[Candida] subhashii TaxID=561895 RepID=A0A8J5UQ93_9ASCO|nr:TGL2 [[Candida] subhashii]KAG7664022.1 TGL2 [[Candida] subhashii]
MMNRNWRRNLSIATRHLQKNEPVLSNSSPTIITTNQFIREEYQPPKHPVVLCHGFSGFDRLALIPKLDYSLLGKKESEVNKEILQNSNALLEFEYWRGVQVVLEELGTKVFIGKVPAFGNIKSRAINLDHFITKQCHVLQNKNQSKEPIKVNLVSHSMGGLDSRYLISKIHNNNKIYKVMSLTTISTPHHGSECADFVVDLIGNNPILKAICPTSIFEMTTENMKSFNSKVLDDPSVQYFSYGARFNPRWYNLFNFTWLITKYQIQSKQKRVGSNQQLSDVFDNDGLVTVRSSMWGKYMGTFDEVDHLDLINWTNQARDAFDRVMFGRKPSFNAIALYLDICNNLAKQGL